MRNFRSGILKTTINKDAVKIMAINSIAGIGVVGSGNGDVMFCVNKIRSAFKLVRPAKNTTVTSVVIAVVSGSGGSDTPVTETATVTKKQQQEQ